MTFLSKDIVVLAIGQALTTTVVSLLTSVSSLSGAHLTPKGSLSTLPVTATVLGTLLMIYPASHVMQRLGRKSGFMIKAGLGMLGGLIGYAGLQMSSFGILILGTFLLGLFNAFGQYYRFAAIEAAASDKEQVTAIGVVMGAGVVGGILGPYLSSRYSDLADAPYAGAFVALIGVCAALAISQCFLSAALGRTDAAQFVEEQPSGKLRLSARFYQATAICAIAFIVMTLVMNAAPLSIQDWGFDLSQSAMVIQAHFIMMYLPSFAIPELVRWLGVKALILAGILASAIGCLLTLIPEQTFWLFILELGLSGLGWSFMFGGGTLLVSKTYRPQQRSRAQGLNSLCVYGGNIVASFSAGALMFSYGWLVVNIVCIPLLLISLLVLWRHRSAAFA